MPVGGTPRNRVVCRLVLQILALLLTKTCHFSDPFSVLAWPVTICPLALFMMVIVFSHSLSYCCLKSITFFVCCTVRV